MIKKTKYRAFWGWFYKKPRPFKKWIKGSIIRCTKVDFHSEIITFIMNKFKIWLDLSRFGQRPRPFWRRPCLYTRLFVCVCLCMCLRLCVSVCMCAVSVVSTSKWMSKTLNQNVLKWTLHYKGAGLDKNQPYVQKSAIFAKISPKLA